MGDWTVTLWSRWEGKNKKTLAMNLDMCYPKKKPGIEMRLYKNRMTTFIKCHEGDSCQWKRQEDGVTDWERCPRKLTKGTLRSRLSENRSFYRYASRVVRGRALNAGECKVICCSSQERMKRWFCQCGWYRGYISDYPSRNTVCIPGFLSLITASANVCIRLS